MVLKRHGRTLNDDLGYKSADKFVVPWSCNRPSGVYRFTVTATDAYGATLTRSGEFRPVGAMRCHVLKIAEARRRREEAEDEATIEHEKERHRREDEPIKNAQRNYCEHDLGGYVEDTNEAADAAEYETECGVGANNITLAGNPSRVVNVTPKLSA
jgi:hypothetical protein